jgi:hypothetical protein
MRTIPIAKSISIQSNVSTFSEAITLLKESNKVFAIVECLCRKKKGLQGKSCKVTDRKEICLAVGDFARRGKHPLEIGVTRSGYFIIHWKVDFIFADLREKPTGYGPC